MEEDIEKPSERWAAVADEVFKAVEVGRIGAVDAWLYTCIARYAHYKTKTCYPSIPTLARLVGRSESTIKRSLKKLKANRLIVAKRSWNNTYYLPYHPDFEKHKK